MRGNYNRPSELLRLQKETGKSYWDLIGRPLYDEGKDSESVIEDDPQKKADLMAAIDYALSLSLDKPEYNEGKDKVTYVAQDSGLSYGSYYDFPTGDVMLDAQKLPKFEGGKDPKQFDDGEDVNRKGNDRGDNKGRYWVDDATMLPELLVTPKGNTIVRDEAGNPALTVGAIRDINPNATIYERVNRELKNNQYNTELPQWIVNMNADRYTNAISPGIGDLVAAGLKPLDATMPSRWVGLFGDNNDKGLLHLFDENNQGLFIGTDTSKPFSKQYAEAHPYLSTITNSIFDIYSINRLAKIKSLLKPIRSTDNILAEPNLINNSNIQLKKGWLNGLFSFSKKQELSLDQIYDLYKNPDKIIDVYTKRAGDIPAELVDDSTILRDGMNVKQLYIDEQIKIIQKTNPNLTYEEAKNILNKNLEKEGISIRDIEDAQGLNVTFDLPENQQFNGVYGDSKVNKYRKALTRTHEDAHLKRGHTSESPLETDSYTTEGFRSPENEKELYLTDKEKSAYGTEILNLLQKTKRNLTGEELKWLHDNAMNIDLPPEMYRMLNMITNYNKAAEWINKHSRIIVGSISTAATANAIDAKSAGYNSGKNPNSKASKTKQFDDAEAARYIGWVENADSIGFDKKRRIWTPPKSAAYDRNSIGMGLDMRKENNPYVYNYLRDNGRLKNPYLTEKEERMLREKTWKQKKDTYMTPFIQKYGPYLNQTGYNRAAGMLWQGHPYKMMNNEDSVTGKAFQRSIKRGDKSLQHTFDTYYGYKDNATRYENRRSRDKLFK